MTEQREPRPRLSDRPMLERLDARHYGDDGTGPAPGVAPPCEECGARERAEDSRLCAECAAGGAEDGE